MWTAANARSLREKEDKSALQRLVRIGIYPLYIQDGGLWTTEEKKAGLSPWGWPTWPLWKQSKKRAVFEFAVPRARGWDLEGESVTNPKEIARRKIDEDYIDFVYDLCQSKKLRRAARWRVAVSGQEWVDDRYETCTLPEFQSKAKPDTKVPWEMGATSCIRAVLPFKKDRALRLGAEIGRRWGALTDWLVGSKLVSKVHVPVVRIEAPDSQDIELDKEVLLLAHRIGLGADWDETLANFELRLAYRRAELDPADFLTID